MNEYTVVLFEPPYDHGMSGGNAEILRVHANTPKEGVEKAIHSCFPADAEWLVLAVFEGHLESVMSGVVVDRYNFSYDAFGKFVGYNEPWKQREFVPHHTPDTIREVK